MVAMPIQKLVPTQTMGRPCVVGVLARPKLGVIFGTEGRPELPPTLDRRRMGTLGM